MIKVEKLVSGYGKIMIIRDVNIHVRQGEIVSIIGRNGVGKSTFMKTLIGLNHAKEGKIYFKGQDISSSASHERARIGIGYVPQGHGIFPKLTVEENLKMGSQINKKEANIDFGILYDYFPRLRERRTQKAGTLSGGEQAMLSISRALVGKPELLLLDEPSEGIQPSIILQISDIIKRINRDWGLTVLFVEQHIGLIQQMSDRCYAMDKGSIVGELTAEVMADYDQIKRYLAV
ncbi:MULTISPECIES: ABC transporter ATP-binding protein [Paenibacillus]|uniref:Urea ABC transporter ATP-binding protein n=1 Tax=Paenibacillus naphthalenovorans TaxID=162209 RepID=A0A0U2M7V9_9BACL|nr:MULTISPECIES: ABC transporter ATP-binding protein [Paenibacillus]ALS24320.1 urea ABC transporter ATP-binding protein [Paenibacillus naphthalenovorans]NTZ20422.1 ABC transporter ATP-binding protein [Paenibacillus sp. JMULE4]GCL73788.1 ABC transporter ATP-binding protein [Paenibacillus naphthalenovorans]SDI53785.1 branched-chain amino acid transport system ATP-binding protein [Paenibacillus naphthalenovorans]